MNVLESLDAAREATNVLEHPFYKRWSAGELSREELASYAGQYRHAVVALADASEEAAASAGEAHSAGLARHAQEERDHIALWDAFAAACGAEEGASPLTGTLDCVAAWRGGGDLLERLAVLYALEASQPAISQTKLDGLREHYADLQEGPAAAYFTLHAVRDVDHAQAAAGLIAELMPSGEAGEQQAARMVARAQEALRGNWSLLDSVQAA